MVLTRLLVLHTIQVPVHLWVHKSVFRHSVMGRSKITGRRVTTFTVPNHLSPFSTFSPIQDIQLNCFYFHAMIFKTLRKP